MTSESLWNIHRDQIDEVDDNASNGKSFKYKTRIIRKQKQDLQKVQMMEMLTDHHNHQ